MSEVKTNETALENNGSVTVINKKLDNVITMRMSVLNTFFQKFPDMTPEKAADENTDIKDILKPPYEMGKSLHNVKEPALVLLKNNSEVLHKEYWINGKRLSEAEAQKLEHDTNFGKKVQDLISE